MGRQAGGELGSKDSRRPRELKQRPMDTGPWCLTETVSGTGQFDENYPMNPIAVSGICRRGTHTRGNISQRGDK